MTSISFTDQEILRLRTLLDTKPHDQPTATHILAVLERGAEAGLELSLGSSRKNPLLLDARRKQLAASLSGRKR
jgi:hypothetical protein